MSLKHNKKKNGRIVYEQLLILATRLARTKHIAESKYILDIVKEFYSPRTMLGKEKKLFDAILKTKLESKDDAKTVLAESLAETRLIDNKRLEKEKVDLINRIMKDIGKDLFSIPIKEYKIYASTQILFNEMRNDFKYSSPNERVKIKNMLLENMNNVPEAVEDYKMDNFTFNILVNKFNKKYSSLMNEDQKQILSQWIDYLLTEDEKRFGEFLNEKLGKIKAEIDLALLNDTHNNSEYSTMLREARLGLSEKTSAINEENVHTIMKYFDLLEDLREIESGQKV